MQTLDPSVASRGTGVHAVPLPEGITAWDESDIIEVSCVYVSVCVCACACVRMCVCVCVRESVCV